MKNQKAFDTNKLVDIEVEGISMSDYPDFCDAYISKACLRHGNIFRELAEDELDTLNNDREFIYKCVMEQIY